MKKTFKSFVDAGEVPNLLLCGTAGIGKTTVAKALCHELGVDSIVINGSDEGRFLDTVRNSAKQFASTVSLTSSAKHKVIIIDLSDYKDSLEVMIQKIRNSGSFIVYGLISKMDIKLQKQAIELGFDMVMTKSNFLHNFKTIQKQILNISKPSKT